MDALSRWREPFAIVLIIALAVRVVLGLVAVPVYAAENLYGSFSLGALVEGTRVADPVLTVATAVVAGWCARPAPTPHARTLVILALAVISAAGLTTLAFALIGLGSPSRAPVLTALDVATALVVPVLAVWALALVFRRLTGPASGTAEPAIETAVQTAAAPAPVPIERQPSWQPDQASGAAWYTAGDAAAGAPAAGWGQPSTPAAWQPIRQAQGWDGSARSPSQPEAGSGPHGAPRGRWSEPPSTPPEGE